MGLWRAVGYVCVCVCVCACVCRMKSIHVRLYVNICKHMFVYYNLCWHMPVFVPGRIDMLWPTVCSTRCVWKSFAVFRWRQLHLCHRVCRTWFYHLGIPQYGSFTWQNECTSARVKALQKVRAWCHHILLVFSTVSRKLKLVSKWPRPHLLAFTTWWVISSAQIDARNIIRCSSLLGHWVAADLKRIEGAQHRLRVPGSIISSKP